MKIPFATALLLVLIVALLPGARAEESVAAAPPGMVLVPGGAFLMGVDPGEKPTNNSPAHSVELKPFWIDRYEVTNRRFAAFIDAKGYEKKEFWSEEGLVWLEAVGRTLPVGWEDRKKALGEGFGVHPVVGVSFFEAEAFAMFSKARLPTEAEWERAARGTDGRTYPWGNSFEAGFDEDSPEPEGGARAVGRNPADRSAAGVFDMGGNVTEWTASWFGPYPKTKYESRLWGENAKRRVRVARGGSYRVLGMGARIAELQMKATYRVFKHPHVNGYPFVGFRLAKDAEAAKSAPIKEGGSSEK